MVCIHMRPSTCIQENHQLIHGEAIGLAVGSQILKYMPFLALHPPPNQQKCV